MSEIKSGVGDCERRFARVCDAGDYPLRASIAVADRGVSSLRLIAGFNIGEAGGGMKICVEADERGKILLVPREVEESVGVVDG